MSSSICPWAKGEDYIAYHNNEWGQACYSRQALFEKLCLEGQQAGLSWITVLRKRQAYREAFYAFDAVRIAAMADEEINALLNNADLIRHRLKLYSIRNNAQALLRLEANGTDFVSFLWQFVGAQPIINKPKTMADIPTQTAQSLAMSKALKKGWL